ncbi:hypothetical protein [Calothrix sp. CCY 0018]|uniref:hypothetical protein n=1 Tax=Calothrix sp. CCY 0018 TaxID=3103864 RepID=UPI0039C5AF3F
MTQNRNKSITHWTYKHDEYCLENEVFTAAKLLWQWLLKKGLIGECEPNLKHFNKWVGKFRARGEYCRNQLKSAFKKLIDCRAINVVKKYTWFEAKIVTRPIEYLKPKKNLRKRTLSDTLVTSNGMFVDAVSYQQQHKRMVENQLLFAEYGIHFNEDDICALDHPRNEILLAIVCYQIKDSRVNDSMGEIRYYRAGKIPNPEGWIKVCLQKRYWDEPTNYAQIFRKYTGTAFWDELFPDGTKFDEEDIFYDPAFSRKYHRKPKKDYCDKGEIKDIYSHWAHCGKDPT